jgi:hypothetical protein
MGFRSRLELGIGIPAAQIAAPNDEVKTCCPARERDNVFTSQSSHGMVEHWNSGMLGRNNLGII